MCVFTYLLELVYSILILLVCLKLGLQFARLLSIGDPYIFIMLYGDCVGLHNSVGLVSLYVNHNIYLPVHVYFYGHFMDMCPIRSSKGTHSKQ